MRLQRSCSGVVTAFLVHRYFVSDIFFVIIKISNFSSILVRNPGNVKPSLADMLWPSMQTLKHIVVMIVVDSLDEDPLFRIPSDLEDMRTKIIIETVSIRIAVRRDGVCREGDHWGRLDEVLTTPGWFSLKWVSLAIYIYESENELALRKLQFPRLSSSNSLSFDFNVKR